MKDSLNIAIAGATGYVGLQLIKILLKHPRVKISYLCAKRSIGKSIFSFDNTINTTHDGIAGLSTFPIFQRRGTGLRTGGGFQKEIS